MMFVRFSQRAHFLYLEPCSDELVAGLVKRFRMMAIINLVLAPFIIIFLFMYFFFRYAEVGGAHILLESDCLLLYCVFFLLRTVE